MTMVPEYKGVRIRLLMQSRWHDARITSEGKVFFANGTRAIDPHRIASIAPGGKFQAKYVEAI